MRSEQYLAAQWLYPVKCDEDYGELVSVESVQTVCRIGLFLITQKA